MSLTEVVVTGYSIIVALCLARLLDGIRPAVQKDARYWVHFVWILNKILNVLIIYWVTWAYMDETLSFGQFLLILLPPVIVYLQCDALVTKNPENVPQWRSHYFNVSRYFFGLNVALGLFLMVQGAFASSDDFPNVLYGMLGMMAAVSSVGYLTKRDAVHAALAAIALVNLSIGFGGYLTQQIVG